MTKRRCAQQGIVNRNNGTSGSNLGLHTLPRRESSLLCIRCLAYNGPTDSTQKHGEPAKQMCQFHNWTPTDAVVIRENLPPLNHRKRQPWEKKYSVTTTKTDTEARLKNGDAKKVWRRNPTSNPTDDQLREHRNWPRRAVIELAITKILNKTERENCHYQIPPWNDDYNKRRFRLDLASMYLKSFQSIYRMVNPTRLFQKLPAEFGEKMVIV